MSLNEISVPTDALKMLSSDRYKKVVKFFPVGEMIWRCFISVNEAFR